MTNFVFTAYLLAIVSLASAWNNGGPMMMMMMPPMPMGNMDNNGDMLAKIVDYASKDRSRISDQSCLENMPYNRMIEFVIDVAANPLGDFEDRRQLGNPIALFMTMNGMMSMDAQSVYFDTIESFINDVSLGVRPGQTCAVIVDNGRKFYVLGRPINTTSSNLDFSIAKALYPKLTNFTPEGPFQGLYSNNLGRMVNLALQNRNNGLPVVLETQRPTMTTVYRVVITDGASGARLSDLTDDASRTTLIDIGGRRLASTLTPTQIRSFANVLALDYPREMLVLNQAIRYLACYIGTKDAK